MSLTILGIGNLLCGDDGIGIHIVKEIENMVNTEEIHLPKKVQLIDAGTLGIDIVPIILNCKKLIIIDAVSCGEKPGSIFKFSPHDINIKKENFISLHQVNIFDVIEIAKKLKKKLPEIIIFGIQPKSMDYSLELSKPVKRSIPKVIKLVLQELKIQIK